MAQNWQDQQIYLIRRRIALDRGLEIYALYQHNSDPLLIDQQFASFVSWINAIVAPEHEKREYRNIFNTATRLQRKV